MGEVSNRLSIILLLCCYRCPCPTHLHIKPGSKGGRQALCKGANSFWDNVPAQLVRLPMSFFHSTPTGRIVNRFTKDTTALDINVPNAIQSFTSCSGALKARLTALLTRDAPGLAPGHDSPPPPPLLKRPRSTHCSIRSVPLALYCCSVPGQRPKQTEGGSAVAGTAQCLSIDY